MQTGGTPLANARSISQFRRQPLLAERSTGWVPDRGITARLMREHHALLENDVDKVSNAILLLEFGAAEKGINAISGMINRRLGSVHRRLDELAKFEKAHRTFSQVRISLEARWAVIGGIAHYAQNILGYPLGIVHSNGALYRKIKDKEQVLATLVDSVERMKNVMSVLQNAEYSNVEFHKYLGHQFIIDLEPKTAKTSGQE